MWYGALAHATRPRPHSSKYRSVVGDTGEVEIDIIARSADTVPAVPHAVAVAHTAPHDPPHAAYAVVSVTPSQARSREISRPKASWRRFRIRPFASPTRVGRPSATSQTSVSARSSAFVTVPGKRASAKFEMVSEIVAALQPSAQTAAALDPALRASGVQASSGA